MGIIVKWIDIYYISLRNLFRSKVRTIINSLIIALGIIILIVTNTLSVGIKDIAEKQILQTRVMREITVLQDNLSSVPCQIDFNLIESLKKIDHINVVYPDIQLTIGLYGGNEWLGVGNVRGIPELGLPPITNGRGYNDNEKSVAILPEKLTFVKGIVNGKNYIGQELQIEYTGIGLNNQQLSDSHSVKVIGTYDQSKKDLPPNAVFLPLNDMILISAKNKGLAEENYFKFSTFNAATVLVDKEEYVEPISLLIEDRGFKTSSLSKELSTMPGAVRFIIVIGNIVSIIVLISGAISIGATMLQTTKSRSKEIGLMKALGYLNKDVFSIFLFEALLTGLIGGIIGAIISYLVLFVIKIVFSNNQLFAGFSLSVFPVTLIVAFLVCLIVPYFGSLLPIMRASRISPSEALKNE